MALRITNEANRCLQCKKPLCREGCPAHTPIPQAIALFKENKLMEAGKLLFENNPMSLVCSMVCDHMAQCAGHCVLGRKDQPVHFYEIERFISAYEENPDTRIIGCSALLTTTMPALEQTVAAINQQPWRGKVKVMVGGAPITQEFADKIGADAYTEDAASAAQKAKELVA